MSSVGDVASAERRELTTTVGVTAALWLLFSAAWPLLPVRWFVTLVHEAGHAAAATVLGGDVSSVTVNRHGGGLTQWSYPGEIPTLQRVLVASAGYVGAAVVGGVMIELAARLRRGRAALLALAALVALIGVAWVPWRFDAEGSVAQATGSSSGDGRFSTVFWLVAAAALVGLAVQPSERLRRVTVLALATSLCLASIDDLRRVLEVSSRGGHSDAAAAAAVTPLSSWMWSAVWLLIGVGACAAGLWSALSSRKRQ
ncbi:MAG TPA: M50 family metallopeptidase [Acidimicrobiales bacterium]|nr:M50 family metallopeptidase [Acidimicrobiales bacterium]